MKSLKQRLGFTLIELIVVFILAATIAGLAITNFRRTIERGKYDNARMNLIAIHSAADIKTARTGTFTLAGGNLAAINALFGLAVVDADFTYTFNGNQAAYSCIAVRTDGSFTLTMNGPATIDATNPSCTAGSCP
jgi:type II secretory pathway pseudopilin PulG